MKQECDRTEVERELLYDELGISTFEFTNSCEQNAVLNKESTPVDGSSKEPVNNSIGIFDFLQSICTAVFFGVMTFIFIFRIAGVDGTSMYSTLAHTDKLFTSNLLYTPQQGDIIILRTPYYSQPLVKRIIALAGQTVDIDFDLGVVYVDGEIIDEPYIYEPTTLRNGFSGPVTVPDGHLFVMGDNRNNSNDSRFPPIGFIDCRAVLGKVYCILIPAKDAFGKRDWSRLGGVY